MLQWGRGTGREGDKRFGSDCACDGSDCACDYHWREEREMGFFLPATVARTYKIYKNAGVVGRKKKYAGVVEGKGNAGVMERKMLALCKEREMLALCKGGNAGVMERNGNDGSYEKKGKCLKF